MRKSNYDKMPATVVDGTLWKGWESIRKRLAEIHAETNGSQVWVVECYQGVHHEELMRELQALAPDRFINTRDLFKSAEDIEAMTYPYLTDDRLFGRRAHFSYTDFLDEEKVNACRESLRDGKAGHRLWPRRRRDRFRSGQIDLCGYGSLGDPDAFP